MVLFLALLKDGDTFQDTRYFICYSKCALKTSSSAPGLLEMQILRPKRRPTEPVRAI